MGILAVVIPIVAGFFIGAGTNQLAIMMLFRPYERRRIFGVTFHGVFPRLQPELAQTAGELVEEEFFSADAVRRHLDQPATREAIRVAIRPVVNDLLNTPLGTPHDIIGSWAPKGTAQALRRQAGAAIASAIDHQFSSPDGRNQVRDLIAKQLVGVLKKPLRDVLDAAAASDAQAVDSLVDAELVAAHTPDLCEPEPPEAVEAQDPHAVIRRMLRVPELMDWLAQSELPKHLADGGTRMIFEAISDSPRIANLLPDDANRSITEIAQAFVPELQTVLADNFSRGPLRGHVLHEARRTVQSVIERRFSKDHLVGKLVSGDLLMSWLDGLIEKVPDQLAGVVKTPGARRAMHDLMRSLVRDVLRHSPRRLGDQIHERMGEELREWLREWLSDGLRSGLMQTHVQRTLLPEIAHWLDRPSGEILARLWNSDTTTGDIDAPSDGAEAAAAAAADNNNDDDDDDDGVTADARDMALARRIAEQVVEQMRPKIISSHAQSLIDRQLDKLFHARLGALRDVFGRNAEPRREPAETADHPGDPTAEDVLDFLADRLSELAKQRVVEAVSAMNIRDLVAENVAAWPPHKLEHAVSQIAKKHLHFVTWVGGVLGATIGALQVLLNLLL